MIDFSKSNARMWSMLGSRGAFGVAMIEVGSNMDNLMVLSSDLSSSSGLDKFKKLYPNKFFNVGIAEQNMIGIAAGLAKEGSTVFATTFATFASMRSCEAIRTNLAYMNLNVKVVGLSGGISLGILGNTHNGLEDLAIMRAIPNLTVLSPADGAEIIKTVIAAAEYKGPVYIRLTGEMNNPIVYNEDYDFTIGKAVTLREGSDITIIATGTMVYESLAAAKLLEKQGISAAVIDMHTIKPLDTSVIDKACKLSKLIVTVEEHSIIGGLGGVVAEYKATIAGAPKQLFIGLPDKFGKAGEYKYLLEKYGLTGKQISEKIKENLNYDY